MGIMSQESAKSLFGAFRPHPYLFAGIRPVSLGAEEHTCSCACVRGCSRSRRCIVIRFWGCCMLCGSIVLHVVMCEPIATLQRKSSMGSTDLSKAPLLAGFEGVAAPDHQAHSRPRASRARRR